MQYFEIVHTVQHDHGQLLAHCSVHKNIVILMSQDSRCTYNVTMRRVRQSLLPWKSNKYYTFVTVCVCARMGGCVRVWTPLASAGT